MLDGQAASSAVDTDLRRAQWIIFLPLDLSPERPESYALSRFLSERPDLAREKNIIAFALNAPYYLDATDISKLTAFYGLYSKPDAFVDVAARLLFRELQPEGASPVSIPGIGYDLISVTSPDPEREFPLTIGLPGFDLVDETTPSNPRFHIGENIPLVTGVILDHNGHPVPDDTPVEFRVSVAGEEIIAATDATVDGVASASIVVERGGAHEIRAVAGDAQSAVLLIEVPEAKPTATPSPTPVPTETATVAPLPPTVPPTVAAPPTIPEHTDAAKLVLWFLGIAISALGGWLAFYSGARIGQVRWGVRWGFAALIGGLLTYSYAMLGLPGLQWATETPSQTGVILVTALGAVIGWGVGAILVRTKK
jgi:beta-N-acetylhexosaminidase